MSGLNPEVKAGTTAKELARLEREWIERKATPPRRGLAARIDQMRKEADKALRAAEAMVEDCRRAQGFLRIAPTLTWDELKALVKKARRGR